MFKKQYPQIPMPRVHPRAFKLEFLEMGPHHMYILKGRQLILQLGLITVVLKQQAFVFIHLDNL